MGRLYIPNKLTSESYEVGRDMKARLVSRTDLSTGKTEYFGNKKEKKVRSHDPEIGSTLLLLVLLLLTCSSPFILSWLGWIFK